MNRSCNAVALSVFLALGLANLDAQNVFVLPATNSSSPTVNVFNSDPFAQSGSFNGTTAASFVLTTTDGLKTYVVSNSSNNTILAVDGTFTTVRNIANLAQGASSAILSSDGKRLIVGAAGSIQLYDTTTDAPVVPNGISVSGIIIDMATSLDSSRLYALSNIGTGTNLIIIDLTSNTVTGTVTVPGFATGISAAPNGFIYISTQNLFIELDPRNNTFRTQISLNARPGKMAFTPDAQLGVAPNLTPITGSTVLVLDLVNRTVTMNIPPAAFPANTVVDKLFPVSPNRVIGYSSASQTVFDISLGPIGANMFLSAGFGAISSAAVSADIATALHPNTRYLFIEASSQLTRIDLNNNQISGTLAIPGSNGPLVTAGAAGTGTPANMLLIGDHQAVTVGGTSLPLVVQLTDQIGRPVFNVPVTFSTTLSGGTLTVTNTVTNVNGLAATSFNTPNTVGVANVQVAAGSLSGTFTINVGNVGGGGVAGALTILSGQGLLMQEQTTTNSALNVVSAPLSVLFTDVKGNIVPNAVITFSLASGQGTLNNGQINQDPLNVQVTTDKNGVATLNFNSTNVFQYPFFFLSTVVASAPDGSSATFDITTFGAAFPPSFQVLTPASGTVLNGQVGQVLAGALKVVTINTLGIPIPNVALQLVNPADPTQPAAASCKGPGGVVLSDAKGVATCDIVIGGQLGTVSVVPLLGGSATLQPITIKVTPGAPATIAILQGDKQSGGAGAKLSLPLVIQVSDAAGNILPGTPVSWSVVTAGSATLTNVVNTTDSSGKASAQVTLGATAGTFKINVTSGGVTQSFTFTVLIPAAGLQIVSGNNQGAQVNTPFASPLAVKVVDAQGNGVAGAPVNFTVISGVAILQNPNTTTDSTGVATTGVSASNVAGPVVINVTSGSLVVVFNLNVRLSGPTNIVFLNGASFQPNSGANGSACPAAGCISPGEIVTVSAVGMLPNVQGVVVGVNILGQLPTSLPNGFSITFNGIAAPIFYVSNSGGKETATIQIPFELQPGTAAVLLTAAGGGTANTNVTVQSLAPGIFTTGTSQNFAVAVRADGSYVSPANPASRGETIGIFANGLGQVTPATGTNRAGVPGETVNANIVVGLATSGGITVVKSEYAVGLIGVYLVTVQIPTNAQPGPQQSVAIGATDAQNNTYFSQTAFIPIQ